MSVLVNKDTKVLVQGFTGALLHKAILEGFFSNIISR